MSANNKNIKSYSATDIQRYLKGQMSAPEMHAIETDALDDPFLADAIEGFEVAMAKGNEESISRDLESLTRQLTRRAQNSGKIVSLIPARLWQISVAAIIVVIAGIALYNNWTKSDQNTPALAINKKQNEPPVTSRAAQERSSSASNADTLKNKDRKSTAPIAPSTQIAPTPPAGKDKNERENRPEAGSQKQKKSNSIAESEDKPDDAVVQLPKKSKSAGNETFSNPAPAVQDPPERLSDVERTAKARRSDPAKDGPTEQLNKYSGRIVDRDNKPLSNAKLQLLTNDSSFITDQKGYFNFTARDSVVDILVALEGFEKGNFRLQNSIAFNNLVLEPDKPHADEAIVSGHVTTRKKDLAENTRSTARVQDAVPLIGWIEYEKYLEKNKKSPANHAVMRGDVVVTFRVERAGILSDFRIEKSLSKVYDAEAIRLIQEGPPWKLFQDRKTRITVIVKF